MREKNTSILTKLALTLLGSLLALPVVASIKPITCKTNFGEKSFTIQGKTVAFHKEKKEGRSISSVLSSRTKRSHRGFKKTLYRDGFKHLISIQNQAKFNSDNDFLAVTSPNGHKMTFPLICK
jgi:hypothetical protein